MKEFTYRENNEIDYEALRKSRIEKLSGCECVREFLLKNNLKIEEVSSLSLLEEYADNLEKCQGCKGMSLCHQDIKGQRMTLGFNGMIYPLKEYCDYYKKDSAEKKYLNNIIYNDIPDNLFDITLENTKPDMNNKDAVNLYVLLNKILYDELDKGLYIYGSFGTGKTYMSIALVNSLARKGRKCAFIKTNDFINRMRKLVINDAEEFEETVDNLKKVQYLVFDDIGTESVSSFVRDDLLFNILDYRMERKLITLFTSNHTMKTLREAFVYDKNNNKETLKGERLMERIRVLTYEQHLGGNNLRK